MVKGDMKGDIIETVLSKEKYPPDFSELKYVLELVNDSMAKKVCELIDDALELNGVFIVALKDFESNITMQRVGFIKRFFFKDKIILEVLPLEVGKVVFENSNVKQEFNLNYRIFI